MAAPRSSSAHRSTQTTGHGTAGISSALDQADAQLQSIREHNQSDQSTQANTMDRTHAASLFAHEVNNLMTQIRGRAQLAMIHPNNPKLVESALETADRAGSQIAQLAEALLADQAPAASGGAQSAPVSLEAIHNQVLGFIDDTDRQAFGFELHYSTNTPPTTCSPGAVHQILLNLYLNAVHAIKAHRSPTLFISDPANTGSIQVRIETQAECSTGNNFGSESGSGSESQTIPMIRIRVEDTGVGMDEHQLTRILHPQRRGSDPGQRLPTTKPNGHGLGLRVCHKLIAQINGRLSAHSTPDVGTTMIVDIPCSNGAHDHTRAAA